MWMQHNASTGTGGRLGAFCSAFGEHLTLGLVTPGESRIHISDLGCYIMAGPCYAQTSL